jgi:3-mercaptopyruvate sulfurtransferase SseA/signal transduction histidine kinase
MNLRVSEDGVGPGTKGSVRFVHPEILVETGWLEEHLNESQLRIFDCTFRITFNPRTMVQIASGREDFEQGHIPGAQFVDVVAELFGRGTVPNAQQFAAVMSSLGVGESTKVVLYSAQNAYWACRVWWLLRVFGFDNASVLNGGWQKWRREGRPSETGPAKSKARARFIVCARPELMARREDVLAAIGDQAICTINALPRDQHLFTSGVHYGRPGHIKGSVNVPSADLLDPETNEFLSADELYRRFQCVEAFNKKVITYCGGGAAASADAMALVMLGHTDVKLYDGSLLEWAADPDLPMEADPVPTSSDQALINIENSGLIAQLRDALEWQTATTEILDTIIRSPGNLEPVFDAILEKVIGLGDAAYCILWSFDGTSFRSAASRRLPEQMSEWWERTTGLHARLIRGDPLVHIADINAKEFDQVGEDFCSFADQGRARTMLMVPLLKGDELVGALSAYRQRVQLFTDNQINLVQHLGSQAVIAIENTRLLRELRQRTDDLSESIQQQTATADVLKVISRSAFELHPALDALLASACRLCEADFGTIRYQDNSEYRLAATLGCKPEWIEQFSRYSTRPDRSSVFGRTIVDGRTVHMPDVLADPDFKRPEVQKLMGFRAALGVPLVREDQTFGVISLFRLAVGSFSEKQIELVQTFADQAVIAIGNVRMFEQVQERTKELAASLDELRMAQDRLVQTQKLASLGQLTAGIAHEIKNPLNFVNNFAAISKELAAELTEALEKSSFDESARSGVRETIQTLNGNLEKILEHGNRADSIVKNMLLHSREGSGDHRPMSINPLVEETLNLAYHGIRAEKPDFNVKLEKMLDPEAGEADIYPQEITRVLLNLISNGFYATAKRKREGDDANFLPALVLSTRNLGQSVEIRIRDNGTGIPGHIKSKMFNPFFTTKPPGEGTGLGLSISHDIVVKQHGGRIEVATEPSSYTEFTIILPRYGYSRFPQEQS